MKFFRSNSVAPGFGLTREYAEPALSPSLEESLELGQQDEHVTVVSADSSLVGDLDVKGDLCVFGRVEGNVKCEGEIFVSESGRINGEALAMCLRVAGFFEGSVECSTLRILDGGRVLGAAAADTFVIEAGGSFEGESRRRNPDNVTQLSRKSRSSDL